MPSGQEATSSQYCSSLYRQSRTRLPSSSCDIFTKSFRAVVLSQHSLIRCSLPRSVSRCLSPGFIRLGQRVVVNEKSKRGRKLTPSPEFHTLMQTSMRLQSSRQPSVVLCKQALSTSVMRLSCSHKRKCSRRAVTRLHCSANEGTLRVNFNVQCCWKAPRIGSLTC